MFSVVHAISSAPCSLLNALWGIAPDDPARSSRGMASRGNARPGRVLLAPAEGLRVRGAV